MHISIYIKDSLLKLVDDAADKSKLSRSKFISRLVSESVNLRAAEPETTALAESRSEPSSPEPSLIRNDCRFFRGETPCEKKKVCWNCDEFAPVGKRALVIKFGAAGDALRTTPILQTLRREGYADITWICDAQSREVLSLAGNIDRLLVNGAVALGVVLTEKFDTVFSFDKDLHAAALAVAANATDKRGFCVTAAGKLGTFDSGAEYALRLGMDDELKFAGNTKTVPELTYEIAGYRFGKEEYGIVASRAEKTDSRRIALNLGVGPKWPTKSWPEENWLALAGILRSKGYEPYFAGGPSEEALMNKLSEKALVKSESPGPLTAFYYFLSSCAGVVTCDSLALHVALAARTQVVGLFCSTVATEIEWYDRGEAIVAPAGPCYNSRCGNWPGCMASISPETVADTVLRRIEMGNRTRI